MGYLNDAKKTSETFTEDNWLRTGDLAKIDSDGFLFITGRLKELIITAGGENIAPVPIEHMLIETLPHLLSNAMLVGDKHKYLSILVTLKCKHNPVNMAPLDELDDECIAFLASIGSHSTKVSELVEGKDMLVCKAIEDGLYAINAKSISRATKVQKFAILPRDFSIMGGELGPTLKLRRPIVTKMYAEVIDTLYAE